MKKPLHYDQDSLVRSLTRLPVKYRFLFALLSATRVFPSYCRFSERTGRGEPQVLESILNRLWSDLSESEISAEELTASLERCLDLIPGEEDGWDEDTQPYAEDAAAALAYVLRTRITGDPIEASWASRRVYEAVDHYVVAQMVPRGATIDEEAVLAAELVQAELQRQNRDLKELLAAEEDGLLVPSIRALRDRSERESDRLFR